MFSIQNQNQVIINLLHLTCVKNISTLLSVFYKANLFLLQAILHLPQVSAILNPRQTAYLRKKQQLKLETPQILCQESFSESVKNCDFSVFKNLNIKTLFQSKFLNNFNVSYISSDSFFENKNGFAESDLKSDAIPTIFVKNHRRFHTSSGFYYKLIDSLLKHNNFTFNIQVRNFKTERSVKAEKLRNPSIVARLKNTLGNTLTFKLSII